MKYRLQCEECRRDVTKYRARTQPAPRFCSNACAVSFRQRVAAAELADRFWAKVCRGDGCWEWQGYRMPKGYGQVGIGHSGLILAHRLAWELTHGPVPTDLFVLHHCDNPPCCNPDHLWLGTKADNNRDMAQKGRHRGTTGKRYKQRPKVSA